MIPAGVSVGTARWSHRAIVAAAAAAILYTLVHFAESGVRYPLSNPNIGQIELEIAPLRTYLEQGGAAPVHTDNPRQYGPVFFFVMHPLMRLFGDDIEPLARALYVLQLICLALSFAFTWRVLSQWIAGHSSSARLQFMALAFLWLNFSPMYTILAGKNVEMWELCLLTGALYAYVTGRRWTTGIAVAAGAMIKLLPFVFFYYFLIRDRRTLVYTALALVGFLSIGHLLYGPQMGLLYFPHIADASVGNTWAMTFHENTSMKAMIVKLFGPLQGYFVVVTPERLWVAQVLNWCALLAVVAWFTWAIVRAHGQPIPARRVIWEWSLMTVMMLIVSPVAAFEWSTLLLGPFSYALFRLFTNPRNIQTRTWICFAAANVLLGSVVPRTVLNRLLFMDAFNRMMGHGHLTASEGFQFYGLPLLGFFLLAATIWQLREEPASPAPVTAAA